MSTINDFIPRDSVMDTFSFRKHLYWISNQLSTPEVENLKFMCNDLVPRRQLEKIHSGFDLFCVLEGKDCISTTDAGFLEEILEIVGKDHLAKRFLNEGGGRGIQERREFGAPHTQPSAESEVRYDSSKLEKEFKKLLVKVGDELTQRNIRDVAFFFQDSSSAALSLQEIDQLRLSSKLFEKLRDEGIITSTNLVKLRATLDTIGRKDVCKIIDDYQAKLPQFVQCPAPTQASQEVEQATTSAVQEQQPPSLHSCSMVATGPHTLVSGCSTHTSSTSGSLPYSTMSSDTSMGSGPPTSFQSYSNPPSLQGGTPMSQTPMTMQSDAGKPAAGGGDGGGTRTQLLLKAVSDQDAIIEQQKQAIQQLERKMADSKKHEQEYQHGQVLELQSKLRQKIGEVNSLQQEASHLRGQLLRAEDVPLYELNASPHGKAVIIVNDTFNPEPFSGAPKLNLGFRNGAQNDLDLFCKLLQYLNYDVVYHKNVEAMQMCGIMDGIAAEDHSNYDSFICCVSTHGDENVMYGSDSVGVKRSEFDEPIKRCESLRHKPKMFFIQACRTTSLPNVGTDYPPPQLVVASKLPPDADIFIANATTARNASYRSPDSGSWFVTALYQVFTEQAHYSTLYVMMDKVNTVICDTRGVLQGDGTQLPNEVSQCAEWTSSFRKGVRFFKPISLPPSTST